MSFDNWEFATDFELNAILDVGQAIEILHHSGPDSLAVFLTLESLRDRTDLTVEVLAKYTGLSLVEVEKACYKLGLELMGIRD